MKTGAFLQHFSIIPDPRSNINRKHLLIDILFITACAVICGAKGWDEIAEFGRFRYLIPGGSMQRENRKISRKFRYCQAYGSKPPEKRAVLQGKHCQKTI